MGASYLLSHFPVVLISTFGSRRNRMHSSPHCGVVRSSPGSRCPWHAAGHSPDAKPASLVFLWAMGRLRGDSMWRPTWIGLSIVTLGVWALATIIAIALPVVETAPTR